MFLAGQGDVALGYRNSLGVLARAVELADLVTKGSKVIGPLRSHLHRSDASHKHNQTNQHDRVPRPTHRH
jgi:hypothetical protein